MNLWYVTLFLSAGYMYSVAIDNADKSPTTSEKYSIWYRDIAAARDSLEYYQLDH
jgi:hypothetical protein